MTVKSDYPQTIFYQSLTSSWIMCNSDDPPPAPASMTTPLILTDDVKTHAEIRLEQEAPKRPLVTMSTFHSEFLDLLHDIAVGADDITVRVEEPLSFNNFQAVFNEVDCNDDVSLDIDIVDFNKNRFLLWSHTFHHLLIMGSVYVDVSLNERFRIRKFMSYTLMNVPTHMLTHEQMSPGYY